MTIIVACIFEYGPDNDVFPWLVLFGGTVFSFLFVYAI